MLLEQVNEIIEFTDSDSLSQAIDIFNEQGIVPASTLPFLNVVFDKAPEQLIQKLSSAGFKGDIQLAQVKNKQDERSYVIFDSHRFSLAQARQWSNVASHITGSCSCNSIRYQLTGSIKKVVNCHCDNCKKMNGSAISTYAAVLDSDFEITQGEVKQFSISDKASKHFCGDCGTPLFNTNVKYSGLKILHIGSLNSMNELTPDVNIYNESQVDWLADVNNMPSLKQKPNSDNATSCASRQLTWSDFGFH